MKQRGTKEKKPWRSMTAVTWLLAAAMLASWGLSMVCLTVVTAQELYNRLYDMSVGFADFAEMWGLRDYYDAASSRYGMQYEYPEWLDYSMCYAIELTDGYSLSLSGANENLLLMRGISIPLDTAVLFYDGDGNILHKNGDLIYFNYTTQEAWEAGEQNLMPYCGWFRLGEGGEGDPYWEFRTRTSLFGLSLRITGTIEGTEIQPAAIYYQRDDEKDWQVLFDNTADAEKQEELVTIYTGSPHRITYEGGPLEYQGERYDSLLALTEGLDFPSWTEAAKYSVEMKAASEFGLGRIVCFSGRTYRDWSKYDGYAADLPEPDYMMVTAIVCHPLKAAVGGLLYVYIGTGLLALGLALAVRNWIKERLVKPLQDVNTEMADRWGMVYSGDGAPPMWREAAELYGHYRAEADRRRVNQNEINRLNTALDYAKRAEEDRRRMTSNIAHELKTPLAIIHSYSEGLKEHIADEKREEYLDVILSETERMDGMVLEMLDLSRLEAGKVKLARDEFSLSALARTTLDKFSRMIAEKELQVELELEEECPVVADEARIGQVMMNLISNAVRYTPEGGTVRVRTYRKGRETGFFVENTGSRLDYEELLKIWEPFYRTDKSRSGKGTGLGLAIVKGIIDLHGGKYYAGNTELGVEFGFSL